MTEDEDARPRDEADVASVKKKRKNKRSIFSKCWCIYWTVAIIIFAWPLSLLVAIFYIIMMPFGVCVPAIQELCDILLKLMQVGSVRSQVGSFASKLRSQGGCVR